MKKSLILCFALMCLFPYSNAKFKMFGLDKAKDKIKEQINKSKETFNEFLEKAKIGHRRNSEKSSKEQFASVITTVGDSSSISGINITENNLEDFLDKIDDFFPTIVFGKDSEFVESLSSAFEISRENVLTVLHNKIDEKYKDTKSSFVILKFSQDVSCEYDQVDEFCKKLAEFLEKKDKITKKRNLKDLDEAVENFITFKANLENLVEVIDKLLS